MITTRNRMLTRQINERELPNNRNYSFVGREHETIESKCGFRGNFSENNIESVRTVLILNSVCFEFVSNFIMDGRHFISDRRHLQIFRLLFDEL